MRRTSAVWRRRRSSDWRRRRRRRAGSYWECAHSFNPAIYQTSYLRILRPSGWQCERSRQLDVVVQAQHAFSNVLTYHGSELKPFSCASSGDPYVRKSRKAIDDEVSRRAHFVMTRACFEQRRLRQPWKALGEEHARRRIERTVERAVARVWIARG